MGKMGLRVLETFGLLACHSVSFNKKEGKWFVVCRRMQR